MNQLYDTYASELADKVFAYDGQNGLFTVGSLPFNNKDFDVVVGDASSGKYKVHLSDNIFSPVKANLYLS